MDGARRRSGIVSRGTRVYLRTLQPEDLDHLSGWAEAPAIDRTPGTGTCWCSASSRTRSTSSAGRTSPTCRSPTPSGTPLTLHNLLPLIALLLNVLLAGITLVRNPDSRLNRLFAYFVTGMAVWNFGVYMLRRSPDELNASFWEIVVHAAVVAIPAFYYHFVLIFLESTTQHRPSLVAVYVLAIFFSVVNLSSSPLFMQA